MNNQLVKIILLHHSTGKRIWLGMTSKIIYKITKNGDLQNYLKKKIREIILNIKLMRLISLGKNNTDGKIIRLTIIIFG